MFDDMDSKALFGSEVFRNLLNQEAQREAQAQHESANLESKALDQFENFQKRVNASPALKNEFKKLQQRFIEDPEYRNTINKDFVQGVLLLSFED